MKIDEAKGFPEWVEEKLGHYPEQGELADGRLFWEYAEYVKALDDEDKAEVRKRNTLYLRKEDLR